MARDLPAEAAADDWPIQPRLLLMIALAAAALALVLAVASVPAPVRVVVLAVALLAAGGAVTLRPRSVPVLAGAALVAGRSSTPQGMFDRAARRLECVPLLPPP